MGIEINIAIVDDMTSDCKALRMLLKQYETKQQCAIQIKEFHSGTQLLHTYIPGSFDIIFLDIYMKNENGVDCAFELRKIDTDVNIIFLTSSFEFGVKSYDVRAVDYIIKPPTLEKLSRALGYCKITVSKNEPTITVTSKQQPLEIILDRILYVDFQNRSACIHLKDCLVTASCSFKELSNQLIVSPQFMICFKGIVVNLKYVQKICGDCLILTNGEQLPISRRLQQQVQQQRLRLSAGSLRGSHV